MISCLAHKHIPTPVERKPDENCVSAFANVLNPLQVLILNEINAQIERTKERYVHPFAWHTSEYAFDTVHLQGSMQAPYVVQGPS